MKTITITITVDVDGSEVYRKYTGEETAHAIDWYTEINSMLETIEKSDVKEF